MPTAFSGAFAADSGRTTDLRGGATRITRRHNPKWRASKNCGTSSARRTTAGATSTFGRRPILLALAAFVALAAAAALSELATLRAAARCTHAAVPDDGARGAAPQGVRSSGLRHQRSASRSIRVVHLNAGAGRRAHAHQHRVCSCSEPASPTARHARRLRQRGDRPRQRARRRRAVPDREQAQRRAHLEVEARTRSLRPTSPSRRLRARLTSPKSSPASDPPLAILDTHGKNVTPDGAAWGLEKKQAAQYADT